MTSTDCHSLLSDEEPPMPWSYRYSTAEELLALKQEPEWDGGGESEAASWACLYPDHDIKEEIVFGPEQLQQQDIAISMQHPLIKTEEDPYLLKLTDEPVCSPVLSGEFQTGKTLNQLPYCFVRLERFILGRQHTSSNLADKTYICNICQKQFTRQNYLTNHIKTHIGYYCHICLEKFEYPRFLTAHIELHKTEPYGCKICKKVYTQLSELNERMLKQNMHKSYYYNIYNQQLMMRKKIYRHINRHRYHTGHMKLKYNMQQHNYDRHDQMRHSKTEQITHMQDTEKEKPHCCTICQRRFVYRKTLHTHMRVRHPKVKEQVTHTQNQEKEKPHSCNICQRRFVYRKTLHTHMRVRHPKVNEQLTHTQNQEKEKPHSCNICQRRFVYRKTLHTHMRVRHSKVNEQLTHTQDHEKEKLHCCTICQKRFVYRKSLHTHMRVRHPKVNEQLTHTQNHEKEKPHCCNICRRRFVYRKTLHTHMRVRHSKSNEQISRMQDNKEKLKEPTQDLITNPDLPEEKTYCCDICQKIFMYRKTLMTHMRIHQEVKEPNKHFDQDSNREKPYSCEICQRRFMHTKTLVYHMRRRHKKTKKRNKVITHESNLIKVKPHSCDLCQKQFVYRQSLITHILKHPENKGNFQHTQPPRFAKQQARLLWKIKQGIMEKAHSCEICHRDFVYRKTLLTHMRIRHKKGNKPNLQLPQNLDLPEEKPHCCDICQKQFMYRKTLISHMRLGHKEVNETNEQFTDNQDLTKEKPYSCDICQRLFMHRKTLLYHMRRRHKKPRERNQKEKSNCCSVCQKRFVYRKSLMTHMHKHPECKLDSHVAPPSNLAKEKQILIEKSHCCEICPRKFVYRKTLLTHMRLRHQKVETNEQHARNQDKHEKVNEYNTQEILTPNSAKHEQDLVKENLQCCDVCQKGFVYRKSLISHIRLGHKEENETNEQFTDNQDLTKEKPYSCDICQRLFMHRKTLLYHMRRGHKKPRERNQKEKSNCCSVCQKRFVYRKSLMTHMHKHPECKLDSHVAPSNLAKEKQILIEKSHCCEICPRKFVYRKTLLTHMRLRHQKVETNEQHARNQDKHEKVNEYNTQEILTPNSAKHEQDLVKENLQCCDICQKGFVYRKSLISHIRKHEGSKHDTLVAQPSSLAKQSQLQKLYVYGLTHRRLRRQRIKKPIEKLSYNHDLEKPHSCDICLRTFVYRKSLLTHIQMRHPKAYKLLVHTLDHEHQKQNEPGTQVAHNQDLNEEKPHCCDICDRRFMYRKTLLTHIRVRHPKANKQLTNTLNHEKENETDTQVAHSQDLTVEKPHCCDICQRRFMYRKTLMTHMQQRHPKEYELNKQQSQTQDISREKPHCCDICQKRFLYRKTLVTHMRLRHQKENESNKQQTQSQDISEEKPHCCDICQRRFVYRKTLVTHMRIRHQKENESNKQQTQTRNISGGKPHCCDICQKRFVYRKTLMTHMRIRHQKENESNKQQTQNQDVSEEKPHCCDICERRFMYRKNLLTHIRVRHSKANKQIARTLNHEKEKENKSDTPVAHNQDLNEEKPHCCEICERRFVYRKTLLTHIRVRHSKANKQVARTLNHEKEKENKSDTPVAHNQDLNEEKPHCCDICPRRFMYRKTLITHMRKHPENKPKVQLTQTPRVAKQQARRLLQIKQDFIQEKSHCCDICPRRFVYRKTLLTHKRLRHDKVKKPGDPHIIHTNVSLKHKDHNKEKPHRCSICRKRFMYKKTLITHMRLRHEKKEINEDLTSSTEHKRKQTDEKHCCQICQKQFVYKKALFTHMRLHKETTDRQLEPSIAVNNVDFIKKQTHALKTYICDICDKQFAHKNTLDNHLRLHSAVKPYCCSVCNKRFKELSSLTTHRRVHTLGKYSLDTSGGNAVQNPYSCNLCCEQFSDLNVLIEHAQKWHAEEGPFRCNIQSVTT